MQMPGLFLLQKILDSTLQFFLTSDDWLLYNLF